MHEHKPPNAVQPCERLSSQVDHHSHRVTVEETADDPALTKAIRARLEVTGFVRDGMPPMMRGMICTG